MTTCSFLGEAWGF